VQRDDNSLRRPLPRRHEGYLRSDLLAVTLRSDREVDVFVLQTTRQNFFVPTRRSTAVFTRSGCICMRPGRIYLQPSIFKKSAWRCEDRQQPAAGRPSIRLCVLSPSHVGAPGLDLPLVTGWFTAVTGLTGLDRLRYRPVTNR
jgi:hypothetical protein